MKTRHTRVIAFANQKGGVGKTTTAVNLAAGLADRGRRMLLMDLDPQANATSGLGVERQPGRSVYGPLLGEGTLREKVTPTAIKRLDIIPSELDLAGAEVDIARSEHYLHGLQRVLTPLLAEGSYDFVFIDCPPSLGILTCNALAAAHALMIPVQCEYLALEGLSMISRLVGQLRTGGANGGLEIEGIVLTMFAGRTKLSVQVVEEVRKHFGDRVYETVIPRNIRVSEAPSFGKPVLLYDPRSAGALAYRALAREFLKRHQPAAAAEPPPEKQTKSPAELPTPPATKPPPAATAAAQERVAPAVTRGAALTSAERLRRAYCHEEMDRPAVYSRPWVPANDPTYTPLLEYLRQYADLKTPWNARACVADLPMEHTREPFSEDYERHSLRLRTPKHPLQASRLVSLKGQPDRQETYLIQSPEDAEAYLSLPLPEIRGSTDAFFEAQRAIGDRGIVEIGLGLNPAGFVAELTGSENFALLSVGARDLVHALCMRQREILARLVLWLVERKIGPYFSLAGEEYVTPPLHGPADFDEFNVRYDKPLIDRIHAAGGRVHVHCHGRIQQVFKGFLAMGADVLHPFEAPPMGDLTAAEAKRLARGRLCLEGNLQIADLYERTPDEIRAATQTLIAAAFDDRRGLIVSPTASPYIRGAGAQCLPQYRAMVETVLGHGG